MTSTEVSTPEPGSLASRETGEFESVSVPGTLVVAACRTSRLDTLALVRLLLSLGCVLCVLLALSTDSSVEAAEDEYATADAVVRAFGEKNHAKLTTLAKADKPDPWHVADALCARGHMKTAEAFAKAARRPDTERLPAYVAGFKPASDDDAARRAGGAAYAANKEKNYAEALKVTENLGGTEVLAIRIATQRAFALREMVRLRASADTLRAAAERAEAIGWLAAAAECLREGGMRAWEHGDVSTATELWGRRLAIAKRRGDRFEVGAATGNLAHDASRGPRSTTRPLTSSGTASGRAPQAPWPSQGRFGWRS